MKCMPRFYSLFNQGTGFVFKGGDSPLFLFLSHQEAIVAKLPKKYFISEHVFDLVSKIPKISYDDFISLSKKALTACNEVTLTEKLKKRQLKKLIVLSAMHNFKVHDKSGSNIKVGVKVKETDLSGPDVAFFDGTESGVLKELTKVRQPAREYKVQLIGKPKPPKEDGPEDDERYVMTPFGPMLASSRSRIRNPEPVMMEVTTFSTLIVERSDTPAPLVQNVYCTRVALAKALSRRLPGYLSIRERNAFKYHICCEITEEEFISLAADTKAQDELVKGLTVKK